MCIPTLWRSAARCAKRAFSPDPKDDAKAAMAPSLPQPRRLEPDESPPAARSTIEYREAHRGFLIRVSPNDDASFSIHVEGARGSNAAKIERRLAAAGVSSAQKFQSLDGAIQSVDAAKGAIDKFLADRGN